MLALPAADIFRRGLALAARTFAHRALVALEIASRPAAGILRRLPKIPFPTNPPANTFIDLPNSSQHVGLI
jgi:hypothetical protein